MISNLRVMPSELQLWVAEPTEIDLARSREIELMRSTDRVTILVSARNEIENLPWLMPQLMRYGCEVLVVDGHSTDGSFEYARQAGARVIRDHGKGKGDAIRHGIQQAQHDIILFIDADGSHDPNHIPRLLAPILEGTADHVIGSRMLGGSEELYTSLPEFIRLVGQQVITLGINYWLHVRLTDPQNGFRAARRETLLKLDLCENLTTVEQEMTIKALRKGFRVVEVPTHEYKRRAGHSKIQLERVWLNYVWSWLKCLFF